MDSTISSQGEDGGTETLVTDETEPDYSFIHEFDITVGRVKVEDKHSNRELIQWKAWASGIERVSDSPTDAVMSVIAELTDGEL